MNAPRCGDATGSGTVASWPAATPSLGSAAAPFEAVILQARQVGQRLKVQNRAQY
jgi:hypothetical protein